ncbi:MAG: Fe2+-enterobactin ABC transporter substrate-binding protein [Ancrocorticia sp.]|jgi:iron complex transport system substrate-binding protein|nr:Fe2+-enterobactin ABC transporter substrate-binding protein [Ancrocorticia sp.]MCI1896035.1 Fe2+-enterobactin ABC transporter substrate-binding protein [Ancrocorticia sp.]MCI1932715.1 Fe2+-enterobactin ABC transporter substrate-binding protein [Ancrocorticia sp.]MCI2012838.1 Fe2+-enterobactin ABC transporter substrate-binding protein [Ancrocorticia sp.]
MRSFTRLTGLVTAGLAAFALTACGTDSPSATESSQAATAEASADAIWPRTVTDEKGEVTLDAQPEKIVSTSISVTGTLLAINAPVVASAATSVSDITDDKGFFSQWADVADERGVDVLYDNLEFSMEALIAADPDLVIVSTSGADSVLDHYDEISAQFPTLVVDYSKQTWQDLATELGEATGHEADAAQAISDFDDYAATAAQSITVPEGGVSIVSYNGPGADQGIAKKTGPHAQLMNELGIDVVEAPADLDTSEQERSDFAFVTFENLSQAIGGDAVFLLSGTEETVQAFESQSVLANLPAVQSGSVYPLGPTSFRIDYYSGKQFIDAVVDALS